MNKERGSEITRKLIFWYDENRRELPWRDTKDPYLIWVSEIMAQQTRIDTLIPYYNRFVKKFPTVLSLATAKEEEVLKLWEGLGYYSRARNMKKAAEKIIMEWKGHFPDTFKELLSLPGIGEYTAGAILSIAFDIQVAAVDGNVLRVFSRLENSGADIAGKEAKQLATHFVRKIMPVERTGTFTQALMELGALICTPQNPSCDSCPVLSYCKAYQMGTQNVLPYKSRKEKRRVEQKMVLIIENEKGEILMRERTEKLLYHLWEFYLLDEWLKDEEIKSHLLAFGYTATKLSGLGETKHLFTHLTWEMRGYHCKVKGKGILNGYKWIQKTEVKDLTIPTAFQFFKKQIE